MTQLMTDVAKLCPEAGDALAQLHHDSAVEYCAVAVAGPGSSLSAVAATSAAMQHGDIRPAGETAILPHPPVPLPFVSTGINRGCHQK